MKKLINLKLNGSVILTFGLCALTAYGADVTGELNVSPSTTLSAAANAALSAVNAANSAAAAATAAAAAAAAAVNAMNAILPPSQRVGPSVNITPYVAIVPPGAKVPAALKLQDSMTDTAISESSDPLNTRLPLGDIVQVNVDDHQEDSLAGRFTVPSEHSLVALVGTFEIQVATDARGEYAAGVAAILTEGAEPVASISGIDLSQAVKASMGFSRDVLIASARTDQAKAQTGQARAFLLPSLLLNAKYGNEVSSPGALIDTKTGKVVSTSTHHRSDTSITLRQPLLDVASLYDWKRREVIEKSREESVRASQGDAYLATVNAYLSLVSSRVQANMALDYEAQMQKLFQYVDKRARAGAASNSDKERVRARSLNAKSSRIEQEATQAAAGVEFVRLVNLAPASLRLPDMEDVGISILPAALQQAMPLAIESNPEIAMLREELRAAAIDQTSAKGRYFPRLDLEISDNVSTNAGGAIGDQHDQRMMVVMNWSIFNGGSDIKFNNEKAARYAEISYKLDDQSRRVVQSLTAQYATLEATRERIVSGYRELESISTAAKAMSSRMLSGNQSLLDMLDVYDRFYQARTRLVTLHIQEMGAVAEIARLVQGTPRTNVAANELKMPLNDGAIAK